MGAWSEAITRKLSYGLCRVPWNVNTRKEFKITDLVERFNRSSSVLKNHRSTLILSIALPLLNKEEKIRDQTVTLPYKLTKCVQKAATFKHISVHPLLSSMYVQVKEQLAIMYHLPLLVNASS